MRRSILILLVPIVGAILALVPGAPEARASDHADPIVRFWSPLDAGLTGLFVFPDDDRLVVVLGSHRGLQTAPPYEDLEDVTFKVHMDLESEVSYDDEAIRARYGGQVVDPTGIRPDVTLTFRLDENGELASHDFTGLRGDGDELPVYAGVRDDPFIFPRFFGTNVLAMVTSIPFSFFPEGQQDWVIWGTAERDGEQVDHVGRSSRTQQARFDFLNTLPPSEHVEAIHDKGHFRERIHGFLMRNLPPAATAYELLFTIRPYDDVPDVMIFTTRYAPGFPNGRRLTDDVAAITCAFGDCILQELSYIEGEAFPRETTNDKEFLDDFPYLAEPWPPTGEEPPQGGIGCCLVVVAGIVVVLLLAAWLGWRWRKRRRA